MSLQKNNSTMDNASVFQDGLDAPTYLITDYIEIVYLPAATCVGTVLNLLVFKRLWKEWRRTDVLSGQRRSYLLLKFNLNIADLMVLLIYAFGRFCWVVAYQWLGGDFLCRAYQFISLTAFHMVAFIMVTIAMDRLRAVYSTVLLRNKRDPSSRFVRNMLILSWTTAILASSGQWCIWRVFSPPFTADFQQCTTIWEIRKVINNTVDKGTFGDSGGLGETTYTLIHLLSAFWIPLAIVVACYTLVCVRYLNHILSIANRFQRHVTESVRLRNRNDNATAGNSTVRKKRCAYRRASTTVVTSADEKTLIIIPSSTPISGNAKTHRSTPSKTRIFRTSGLIVMGFVTCWLPYNVLVLWKLVDPTWYVKLSEEFHMLNALIVLNSVFNPLIYGFH